LADWEFDRWITEEANAKYDRLRTIAETAVSGEFGPLPINSDPRLTTRLGAVRHYERTRKIIKSIVKPQDVRQDLGLIGIYQWVRYRTELGTCVYFMRFIEPPAVLVLDFSESPLDTNAIRKLVASGNSHILHKLRLPLPGSAPFTVH
jgi:hypothetical protein